MPLLQLVLEKANGIKKKVVLPGGIAKQPLTLKHFTIYITATDSDFLPFGSILVQLPFLNTYDVNTNCVIQNAIMLPLGYLEPIGVTDDFFVGQNMGMIDILFNPARNITSEFDNFEVYESDGEIITVDYTIVLMFEYRRPDLI